ncbi:hypothetical protein AB0E08_07665 [Streptomyces sp. NPDC048281]|uniref:hypothetical protein n=1 Tax=Streptomyces sp. NPDC048281 TaxID=3154715 RepID=UPI0034128E32
MNTTTTRTGTTVTLLYSPQGSNEVVRRSFTGMTEDDIVVVTACLAGRRMPLPELHAADMEQLKESREQQMAWYADQMAMAMYDGLGRWFKFIPLRVRVNTVQLLMDYLRSITATWTGELVAAHAEVRRTHAQAHALLRRPRELPSGPRARCGCCKATAVVSDNNTTLPLGWTADENGTPRCPKHPVVTLMKDRVG